MRVLYAGAADVVRPRSGLDLASRGHFEEIAGDGRLHVTAVSVSPEPVDPAAAARFPVQLLASDASGPQGRGAALRRKLGLLLRLGILFHTGVVSDAARRRLREALRGDPDVLVIDNVSALANLPLPTLCRVRLRGRTRILVIAHDATAAVMRDRAGLQRSRVRAALLRLHALHCHLFERAALGLAHRVVFISGADRGAFATLPARKVEVMCMIPAAGERAPPASGAPEPGADTLLFVGGPGFYANAYAIGWLREAFAPALAAIRPELRIVLVGKGTEPLVAGGPDNMAALGFVDEGRLAALFAGCAGLLSPVVHGSGLKMKVLDAVSAGCAVFATGFSLRGYEFMELAPVLAIDDPAGSAARVAAVVGDAGRLEAARAAVRARWAAFVAWRRGRLADLVAGMGA